MPTLTFTFDTGSQAIGDIVDAVCQLYGYQDTIDGLPNPQTRAQFAREQVRQFIISAVKGKQARDLAASILPPNIT